MSSSTSGNAASFSGVIKLKILAYFLMGVVHLVLAVACHLSFDCCVSLVDTSSSVEVLDWHLFFFDLPLLQIRKQSKQFMDGLSLLQISTL